MNRIGGFGRFWDRESNPAYNFHQAKTNHARTTRERHATSYSLCRVRDPVAAPGGNPLRFRIWDRLLAGQFGGLFRFRRDLVIYCHGLSLHVMHFNATVFVLDA